MNTLSINTLSINKSKTPRWTILGAGSVGYLLACRFAIAKIPAVLVRRQYSTDSEQHTQTIYYNRGQCDSEPCDSVPPKLKINCVMPSKIDSIENLILTVKAHQVVTALNSIRKHLNTHTQIFLLQNGMGIVEQIMENFCDVIHANNIYVGSNTHGVFLAKSLTTTENKFTLNHVGEGSIQLGTNYLAPNLNEKPQCLIELDQLDLNICWEDEILSVLWLKLAVNAAINPLTAIHQCLNGELAESKKLIKIVNDVCYEVADLYLVLKLNLSTKVICEAVFQVIKTTAKNQSSMLQDVLNEQSTEIEYISGYLLENADKMNIAMPVLKNYYQLIKQLQV